MDTIYHSDNEIFWFCFICKSFFYTLLKFWNEEVALCWKNGTFHLITVKIKLFNISKFTPFFRHYIPQNSLLTVKNSELLLLDGSKGREVILKNTLPGLINYFSVILVFVLSSDECYNGSTLKWVHQKCHLVFQMRQWKASWFFWYYATKSHVQINTGNAHICHFDGST